MQKTLTKYLSLSLEGHISLWRTRRETLVWLVALIIQTGTVSLWTRTAKVEDVLSKGHTPSPSLCGLE
jgi:hypothetical protein